MTVREEPDELRALNPYALVAATPSSIAAPTSTDAPRIRVWPELTPRVWLITLWALALAGFMLGEALGAVMLLLVACRWLAYGANRMRGWTLDDRLTNILTLTLLELTQGALLLLVLAVSPDDATPWVSPLVGVCRAVVMLGLAIWLLMRPGRDPLFWLIAFHGAIWLGSIGILIVVFVLRHASDALKLPPAGEQLIHGVCAFCAASLAWRARAAMPPPSPTPW